MSEKAYACTKNLKPNNRFFSKVPLPYALGPAPLKQTVFRYLAGSAVNIQLFYRSIVI